MTLSACSFRCDCNMRLTLSMLLLLVTVKSIPADSCHSLLCATKSTTYGDLQTVPCCNTTSHQCKDIEVLSIGYRSCDNKTAELNSTLTSPYLELTLLEISGYFSIITSDALARLDLLKTLIITKTNITELPSGLFDSNSNLETVKITGNGFKNVPDTIFQLGSRLKEFDFS